MRKIEQLKRQIERKMEEERQAIAKAIGIDRDFRPVGLVYNEASDTIIASVERHSADTFDRRLFFRHSSERTYRQLGSPPAGIHYDDLITSPRLPVIYYSVGHVTKSGRVGWFAGDWLSVDRFDLDHHTAESVITKGGLKLPEPYTDGWVSRLFSVSTDDSAIMCSCGLQGGEKDRAHYWLCRVHSRTQRVTLLSRLEAVWF